MPTMLKKFVTAFLVGAFMVSSAWAGSSLVPVNEKNSANATIAGKKKAKKKKKAYRNRATPATNPRAADDPVTIPDPGSLKDGQVLAGAAKISIEPRPEDYGGTWEKDPE